MTRLGWGILGLILLLLAGLASITSFSVSTRPPAPPPAPQPVTESAWRVPVRGVAVSELTDNWGEPRDGGTRPHHGLDIMAPGGTPVIAAAAGTVEKLFHSGEGGITAYVRTADASWMHYYAHLSGYAAGLHEGQRVAASETIGFVGDTGNAGAGNTHLHFGVTRMRGGERWWQGEDVNPYPLLAAGAVRR